VNVLAVALNFAYFGVLRAPPADIFPVLHAATAQHTLPCSVAFLSGAGQCLAGTDTDAGCRFPAQVVNVSEWYGSHAGGQPEELLGVRSQFYQHVVGKTRFADECILVQR
jgi:hypothetical protein